MATVAEPLREAAEATQALDVPKWAWKFIHRIARLRHGEVFTVTLFMVDGEPVWTVQPMGRVENVDGR